MKQRDKIQALQDEYAFLQFLKIYFKKELVKADRRQEKIKKLLDK